MPVTSVTKDVEALTLSVVADFNAPVRRLWDAYLDPRQIERFWSPPSFPTDMKYSYRCLSDPRCTGGNDES
jgi:uncharacterized protein YndB with AHSA1/START domain